MYKHICKSCGKPFEKPQTTYVFCSPKCRRDWDEENFPAPTPQEISKGCKEIQLGWSENKRRKRRVKNYDVEIPIYERDPNCNEIKE